MVNVFFYAKEDVRGESQLGPHVETTCVPRVGELVKIYDVGSKRQRMVGIVALVEHAYPRDNNNVAYTPQANVFLKIQEVR